MAVGEEAIMSNAMEAARQHVEQETPHELADVEAHDFALVSTALPIVLPAETDVGLVEIEQAAVGDRDAMRIAREIGQDLLGTGEGLFGIDDPFSLAQRREVRSELVARGSVQRRFLQRLRGSALALDYNHGVAETSPFRECRVPGRVDEVVSDVKRSASRVRCRQQRLL